ncbi:hypothetical protein HDV01_002214 [Terramyces sp. JEL0728]|nr:hypothetical protein HDV01_002214 [Terramyces sp. JEL0728]
MKFIVLASVAIAAPAYGAYGQQAPVAIPTNTDCSEEMAAYSTSVAAYDAAQTQAPVANYGAAYGAQTTDSPVIATPSAYGGYGAQDLPVVATTTPCEQDLPQVQPTTAAYDDDCEEDQAEVTTAPAYDAPVAYGTATADLPVIATTASAYSANVISNAQTAGFSVFAAAAFILAL